MPPTLIGVLSVTFVVIQFVPGGPVEQIMAEARIGKGAEGSVYKAGRDSDAKQLEELKKLYGFDKPVGQRYVEMLSSFARFDLGRSFMHRSFLHFNANFSRWMGFPLANDAIALEEVEFALIACQPIVQHFPAVFANVRWAIPVVCGRLRELSRIGHAWYLDPVLAHEAMNGFAILDERIGEDFGNRVHRPGGDAPGDQPLDQFPGLEAADKFLHPGLDFVAVDEPRASCLEPFVVGKLPGAQEVGIWL